MSSRTVSKEQIAGYYDSTEIDYRLIWNLKESGAMHFGYWDEKVKSFPQSLQRENEILAEMAGIKNSDAVLDAGCGVGGSSIFLAKNFGCMVTGITLSRKQAETAAKNAELAGVSGNTEFLVMDFEDMSFPGGKFDVVWAIESVCHANSKKRFIANAYRVLKPGGRLIVADGFASRDHYEPDERKMMQKGLLGWGVGFLETGNNFGKFLRETGFHRISFRDVTENVMPSSKRLYRYSFPGMFLGKMAELLKLRTKAQRGNIIAARYQYIAFMKGLCRYGIFYAEK